MQHAEAEYDRYKQQQLTEKSAIEKDFEESLKYLKKLEKSSK